MARSDNARSAPIDKREAAEAASLFCAQVHSHVARLKVQLTTASGALFWRHSGAICGRRRGWLDMRDLGAVLATTSPCLIPHAIKRSSLQDHQRSVVMRRRDDCPAKFEGTTRSLWGCELGQRLTCRRVRCCTFFENAPCQGLAIPSKVYCTSRK